MKVLYIHQYFATGAGSTGTRSYDFSRHLVSRGHRVTLITGHSELGPQDRLVEKRIIEGIEVVSLRVNYDNKMVPWRRIAAFLFFMCLATLVALRQGRHDVVFATSTPLTVGVTGFVVSRVRRVPFVFEVRDLWPESVEDLGVIKTRLILGPAYRLEAFLYHTAARIIVVSDGIKKRLVQRGIPEHKVRVIYLGADNRLFAGARGDGYRRLLGLEGKIVLAYVGAHGRANGLDFVIDLAASVAGDDRFRFLLVGRGSERERLIKRAGEMGLENIVFRPPVAREQIPEVLSAADAGMVILVDVPIFKTAFNNKFFDYLAAGLPVLVNFTGDISEAVEKHRAGFYVPAADPARAGGILLEKTCEPGLLRQMGENARALARRYDRREMARWFEQTLLEVVA